MTRTEYIDYLKALVKALDEMTDPAHPPRGVDYHQYKDSTTFPGICEICGWINPALQQRMGCGHTVLDHAEIHLEEYKRLLRGAEKMSDEEYSRIHQISTTISDNVREILANLMNVHKKHTNGPNGRIWLN